MKRLFFASLLAGGLAILGFGLALLLASEFVYPGPPELDRGLARLSFGLGGAFAGFAAAILLGFLLKPPHVLRIALAALLVGGTVLGLIAWRAAQQRAVRAAQARAADAAARLIPPPLPGPGMDTLRGLVTVSPEMLSRFETREHAYEEEAVTVYARRQDWYLVGLRDGGRAWLNTNQTGRYFPVEELVVNQNNYLTEAWDTRLRDVPDESVPAREVKVVGAGSKEIPANVLEAREAGGRLWFRVEVLDRSPCEGDTPKPIAGGWIPVWGYGHKPTAWFYSRGC